MSLIARSIGHPFPARLQQDPPPAGPEQAPRDVAEALGDTANSATAAASELARWLYSGSGDALIALAFTIAVIALLFAAKWGLSKLVARLPRKDEVSLSDIFGRIVSRFRAYFIVAIAMAITNSAMPLPPNVSDFISGLLVLTSVLQVAEWVQEAVISVVRRNVRRSGSDASSLASAVNIIKWFVSVTVWSVAVLMILSNVGADVTTLIAGLGIGGIAIGLAAQGMFRDLFSSLSIIFAKPFQVGDVIGYGETWGTVEDIGLKTTRIRDVKGEQVIMNNTLLLEYEIHNMKRMSRRRIDLSFGIVYQTPPDLAEAVPALVAETVKAIPGTDFEFCAMTGYGASSLDYELRFYALNPDYNRAKVLKSRVLLAIFRRFHDEGISFAYPTRTLYIAGKDAGNDTRELQALVEAERGEA